MAESIESLNLGIDFTWEAVPDQAGKPLSYPNPVGHLRGRYSRPAIYRWTIREEGAIVAVGFGECDNLVERLNTYYNPRGPQKADARIKSALSERMLLGQPGTLDILVARSISVGGRSLGSDALNDGSIRKAIESLLLYEAGSQKVELLNKEESVRDLLSLL